MATALPQWWRVMKHLSWERPLGFVLSKKIDYVQVITLIAMLFAAAGAMAQSGEYVIEAEYSNSSYLEFKNINATELDLMETLSTHGSENECLNKLASDEIENMALALLNEYDISDIRVRCKKYWTIKDCEPEWVTGNFCIGIADVGAPISYTFLMGELVINQKTLPQIVSARNRLKTGPYQVLQHAQIGRFDDELRTFITTQVEYNQNGFSKVLGESIPQCKNLLKHPIAIKKTQESLTYYEHADILLLRCFHVDQNGYVTKTGTLRLER